MVHAKLSLPQPQSQSLKTRRLSLAGTKCSSACQNNPVISGADGACFCLEQCTSSVDPVTLADSSDTHSFAVGMGRFYETSVGDPVCLTRILSASHPAQLRPVCVWRSSTLAGTTRPGPSRTRPRSTQCVYLCATSTCPRMRRSSSSLTRDGTTPAPATGTGFNFDNI